MAEIPEEEMQGLICEANACGHVDTDARSEGEHGHMTPHDWEGLVSSVLHALGLIDEGHCYTCYSAREYEEMQEQDWYGRAR